MFSKSLICFCALISVVTLINGQDLPFRLPRSVIPYRYRLQIISVLDEIPQYTRFTAPAKVWIRVNCTESTNTITLHQINLQINEAEIKVLDSSNASLAIASIQHQSEYDFFKIILQTQLISGQSYEIYIPYTAPISADRLDGMYLDSYVDPATNQTRYVSTTLFAANTARRAFPSFDEPEMKAEFEIILGRAGDYHALSNTHLVSTEEMTEIQGWFWDSFALTPKMSTYLVCMIVSDLTFEEAPSGPGEAIHRVYAPYYFINRGGGIYSANLSKTVNDAFSSYYNISFPLRKLDNVALPQFFYNAMENWGLMTYADRVLLYFPGETSEAQRYQLSLTVSHEVSHNLFGNLVTCSWWTYVWLNEGWATFASHQGLEMTFPELRPWDNFIPNIYQEAMNTDSGPRTHPIANEPQTSSAIGGIYNDIPYKKGASVIRMIESFVGENVLQTAVRRYLQKFQYNVASEDDLFAELQTAVNDLNPTALPSGVTIKQILDTWTHQAGFPLLNASRLSANQIQLKQQQFVRSDVSDFITGNEKWWIPIEIQVFSGGSSDTRTYWMSNTATDLTINIPETDFIFVNPRSIGYYRVLYARNLHEALLDNYEHLSPIMRSKLIDDTFSLIMSKQSEMNLGSQLNSFMSSENDFIVWKTLRRTIGKLLVQLQGTLYGDRLKRQVKNKIQSTILTSNMMQNMDSQLLSEELNDWIKELSEKELSTAEISSIISEMLNQSSNNATTSVISIYNIAQNGKMRSTLLEDLKERLIIAKTPRDIHKLMRLVEDVCKFGNSKKDLVQIIELGEIHQSPLQTCLNNIHENLKMKAFILSNMQTTITNCFKKIIQRAD